LSKPSERVESTSSEIFDILISHVITVSRTRSLLLREIGRPGRLLILTKARLSTALLGGCLSLFGLSDRLRSTFERNLRFLSRSPIYSFESGTLIASRLESIQIESGRIRFETELSIRYTGVDDIGETILFLVNAIEKNHNRPTAAYNLNYTYGWIQNLLIPHISVDSGASFILPYSVSVQFITRHTASLKRDDPGKHKKLE
jgi:hypothetical protein